MGHRREILEDAALRLSDALGPMGAELREAIPAGAIQSDEHVPALAIRLRHIADAPWAAEDVRAEAARLLAVTDDLHAALGRCGSVWVTWSEPSPRARAHGVDDPAQYECWWHDEDYCGRAEFAALDAALAWARDRSDEVHVRPSWDPAVHYWAGTGPAPDGLPPLPPAGVRVEPLPRRAEHGERPRDPEPFVPDDPLRLRTPPPFTDFLHDISWPAALDVTDAVLLRAVIERGEEPASVLERHLRWLTGEVRGLLADLQARGVDSR